LVLFYCPEHLLCKLITGVGFIRNILKDVDMRAEKERI
jgi:hypothetical protein